MHRINHVVFFFFILSLLALASCDNDEQPVTQNPIVATWRTGTVLIDGVADGADYSSFRWVFRSDGTYEFTSSFGASEKGKWKLFTDDTEMILDEGTPNQRYVIIKRLTSENFDWQLKTKKFKQSEVIIDYQLVPVR